MGSWNGNTFRGLKDPPAPSFYRQEQLSPRKRRSLVPLIIGRIETNIAIALWWVKNLSRSSSIFTLLICCFSSQSPSARYVKTVINLSVSRKSFPGCHWEQEISVDKKTLSSSTLWMASKLVPCPLPPFFSWSTVAGNTLTWDETHIRERLSP